MRRVLVLGGYGGFGARVSLLLARGGFEVVVAGRSGERAAAFCGAHPELPLSPLRADRNGDVGALLGEVRPWLLVDAAGPFQDSGYGVAESCIAAGCHYLDLADARAFVCGIAALDEAAKARGVAVISGASSVPALSSAVAGRLARGMERVTAIDAALSASNRASGGVSVTRAILSYVGKPVHMWRGQAWREAFGWGEMGKVRFAVPGRAPLRRRVAVCDVPDLDLLQDLYPGRPAVRFRAGTELEVQNVALGLLGLIVRWRLVRSLAGLTGIGVTLQRWMRPIGGDRSAMRAVVKGWSGGRALERRWTLLAEAGDGPWIPALAVPLLARRMTEGVEPGARSAAGALGLDEFERAFAGFQIHTAEAEAERQPLYARLMGEEFDRLPPAVRDAHLVNGELVLAGRAEVKRGRRLVARLLCHMLGFPPDAADVPVTVWMDEADGAETWHRDFGGRRFKTRLSRRGPLLIERFGLIRIGMELKPEPDGLGMHIRGWWLGPLPLPRFLAPRGVAREKSVDGRFTFDVPISLPLVGLLIHYRGWLRSKAEA